MESKERRVVPYQIIIYFHIYTRIYKNIEIIKTLLLNDKM